MLGSKVVTLEVAMSEAWCEAQGVAKEAGRERGGQGAGCRSPFSTFI